MGRDNRSDCCPSKSGYVVREIEGGQVRLYFNVKGDLNNTKNRPILVFIHGFGADHRIWQCQQKKLCKCFATISVDLRGFGRTITVPESLTNTSSYSYQMFAEDLKAVIDALVDDPVKTPVTLIGSNLGASIAIRFTNLYQNIVEKLILAGPNPLFVTETRNQATANPDFVTGWRYAQFTTAELAGTFAAIQANYPAFVDAFVRDTIYTDLCANKSGLIEYGIDVTPPEATLLQIIGFNNPLSFSRENLIADVTNISSVLHIPTLVLTGTAASDLSRGAAGFLWIRFTQNGNSDSLFYEFLGKANYMNATDVTLYNQVVEKYLCLDLTEGCCDVCPINNCDGERRNSNVSSKKSRKIKDKRIVRKH